MTFRFVLLLMGFLASATAFAGAGGEEFEKAGAAARPSRALVPHVGTAATALDEGAPAPEGPSVPTLHYLVKMLGVKLPAAQSDFMRDCVMRGFRLDDHHRVVWDRDAESGQFTGPALFCEDERVVELDDAIVFSGRNPVVPSYALAHFNAFFPDTTELNLSGNKIGDKGVIALGGALRTNTTLSTLYLSGNRIGDLGGRALEEAIRTSRTLRMLDLRHNQIGQEQQAALQEVVQNSDRNIRIILST